MRCLIRIPTSTRWQSYRGRNGKRYQFESFQMEKEIETTVYKLTRPRTQSETDPFVWVDAFIPEDSRSGIPVLSSGWVADGVLRTKATLKKNAKTLAPFLASGLDEMDVRETE